MAPVPFEVLLNEEIRLVKEQIRQAKDDLFLYRAVDKPVPIHEIGKLTRLLERRHALELQRTYPNARVYTQLTFGPVADPDTGEAIRLRGARQRRPDIGVVAGETLYLVEAKVLNEILDMFPKGSKARRSIEKYEKPKKSSTFGREWKTERSLLDRAAKRGGYQAFNGTYVLGGREELLVRTTDPKYGGSHPQVYGNMGDGLPIKGPGSPPAPTIRRVQRIDAQPSADAIRAAKLNKPVPGTKAKTRSAGAVTPDALRAAKPTRGVVIPKVKPPNMPARGVPAGPSAPNRMVEGRAVPAPSALPPTLGTRQPGRTFETVPPKWSTRIGGNVRASMAQGVAQAFHDFMSRGMHDAAMRAAERAAASKWFADRVFAARRTGAWVLVTAAFAESDAANAGGTRHLVFRWVDYRVTYELPGESPDRTLKRLREQVKPDSAQWASRHEQPRSSEFHMDGWRMVQREMYLFPGEPAEEVVSEPDPTGLGVGRCVVRKLR